MNTIFNVRNRAAAAAPGVGHHRIAGGGCLALVAAIVGWRLYQSLTTNTVVAYFPEANALYPGTRSRSSACARVAVDKIEPAGDKMKVIFTTHGTRCRPKHPR